MNRTEQKEKVIVKWLTRDKAAIEAIRKKFGMPDYTTINGWTPVEIKLSDRAMFEECAKRRFFSIIREKWRKIGGLYIFNSRK